MEDGSRSGSSSYKANSIIQNLKSEWSLFWDSISSEILEGKEDPFKTGRVQVLSIEQIRDITMALSKSRRHVNQRMELLNKEIELNSAKLESMRYLGQEDDVTLQRINELSDQGQALSQELARIDERLKLIRQTEDDLKKRTQPA